MFDLPLRLALVWQGWAWGSACLIAGSYAAPRSRPVTPSKAVIEAELAAMPVGETVTLPKASKAEARRAALMARSMRDLMSTDPAVVARGEEGLRRYAATTPPSVARRAAKRRSS